MSQETSHVILRRTARIGFGALALLAAMPALAADLAYPYPPAEPAPRRIYREERIEEALPPPPPRAEPGFEAPRFVAGPRFAPPEPCRVVVRRHIDVDGDEVERRVRLCEDGPPRYRPSLHDPGPPPPPADIPDEGFEEPPPRW